MSGTFRWLLFGLAWVERVNGIVLLCSLCFLCIPYISTVKLSEIHQIVGGACQNRHEKRWRHAGTLCGNLDWLRTFDVCSTDFLQYGHPFPPLKMDQRLNTAKPLHAFNFFSLKIFTELLKHCFCIICDCIWYCVSNPK